MTPNIYLFGDGSCGVGENIGGWAAAIVSPGRKKVLYGGLSVTTVSRCELMPIIEGLRWIRDNMFRVGMHVHVYSDSEYTVLTLNGLYARGKNQELWAAVDAAKGKLTVDYFWRARNTHPYMEFCDQLSKDARQAMLDGHQQIFVGEQPESKLPVCEPPEEVAIDSEKIDQKHKNTKAGDISRT